MSDTVTRLNRVCMGIRSAFSARNIWLRRIGRWAMMASATAMLSACAGKGTLPESNDTRYPGEFKIGKPYQIQGVWYYPAYDPDYDATGVASWYGPGFHGKMTANGERFNENELTAAHPTLPMPSLVKVTNLSNGKQIIVRVNDRGPFAKGRIIDLSKGSAKALDFHGKGLERVRVQFLKEETERFLAENNVRKRELYLAAKQQELGGGETRVASRGVVVSAPVVAVDSQPIAPVTISNLPTPPESTTVTQRLHGRVPSVLQPTTVQAANMDEVPAASQMGTPLPSRPGAPLSPGNGEIATTAPAREEDLVPRHIDGQFYVQAGSFRVSENAYQLAQRLKSYYEAKISPVVIEGVQWYRVQLGPINDFNTARQLLDKISHYGLTGAKIINE